MHWRGLAGWQWIFILEGIPAVIFGILTLFYLTDRPRQARWLQPEEREWITAELEREKQREKSGALLHGLAGAGASRRRSSGPGLFSFSRRRLRCHLLAAHHHPAALLTAELDGHVDLRLSLLAGPGHDGVERMVLGPVRRAALAYGAAAVCNRCGPAAQRGGGHPSHRCHCHVHHRHSLHVDLYAFLLGAANSHPQRGRRSRLHRLDQFSGEPWRLRRSLRRRLPPNSHWLHGGRA